jgi:hypothetical protein
MLERDSGPLCGIAIWYTEFIGLGTELFKLFGLFKLLFSVKCNRFGTIFIKDRCF